MIRREKMANRQCSTVHDDKSVIAVVTSLGEKMNDELG